MKTPVIKEVFTKEGYVLRVIDPVKDHKSTWMKNYNFFRGKQLQDAAPELFKAGHTRKVGL